jgi:hypothetical protein
VGCVRYTVAATLVGRIDGTATPGVVRDNNGKFTGLNGFGNLNGYSARLVTAICHRRVLPGNRLSEERGSDKR